MIQKNLLLAFLSIMIVEKIIVISKKLCCGQKQSTSRPRLGMVQNLLRNNSVFGCQEGENPRNKIHPEIVIGTEKEIITRPSLGMAMLDISKLSELNGYNDVGTLREQIENLRKKSAITNADPARLMASRNYPTLSPFGVNFLQ